MTALAVFLILAAAFVLPLAALELHFLRRDRREAPAEREWTAVRAAWLAEQETQR